MIRILQVVNEHERMNIAIISHSAGGGGAERVAVNLANHLLNENEVFFCAVHSDRREYYLDPKVQYDYIGTERSGFRGQLSIAINLRKYIKKNNIEVMISFISVEGIFLIGNKKLFKIYSLIASLVLWCSSYCATSSTVGGLVPKYVK